MIRVTIRDALAFLPFDPVYKEELVKKLETADFATKFALEDMLWQTYDALCDLYFQKNYQKGLLEVGEGKRSIGQNFYKDIRVETDKEIEVDMTKQTTKFGIEDVRKKLKKYIHEEK